MYERKMPNHRQAAVSILSSSEEISRYEYGEVILHSYDTDVLRIEIHCKEGVDIYPINIDMWSLSTRKHIQWFVKYLNDVLTLDLTYYHIKAAALLEQEDLEFIRKHSDFYADWLSDPDYGFRLESYYVKSYNRYYNKVTGEIVEFGAIPNDWIKRTPLKIQDWLKPHRRARR